MSEREIREIQIYLDWLTGLISRWPMLHEEGDLLHGYAMNEASRLLGVIERATNLSN